MVATLLLLKSLLPCGGYCSLELRACRPAETVWLQHLNHDTATGQQNVSTVGLVWHTGYPVESCLYQAVRDTCSWNWKIIVLWSSDLQAFSTCWVSSRLPGKLAKIEHVGRGQIGQKKGKILQEMENYLTGHLSLFKLWKTLELLPRLQHSYHLLPRWPLSLSWQHCAFIRSIFWEKSIY